VISQQLFYSFILLTSLFINKKKKGI